MPAACAFSTEASAAARRRNFEEFLGVHESPIQQPPTRLRRRRAGHVADELRNGALTALNFHKSIPGLTLPKWFNAHYAKSVWPTSFADENDGKISEHVANIQNNIKPIGTENETSEFEVNWKSAAIMAGVAAVSGGVGFATATMMTRPPPEAGGLEAPREDEILAATTMDETRRPADTTSSTDTPATSSRIDASAPEVAPQEEANPPEPTPEELERQQRIAELEAQRESIEERKQELQTRREDAVRDIEPELEQVRAEISELEFKIAAEKAGIQQEEGSLTVSDQQVIAEARQADLETLHSIAGVYDQVVPLVLQGQRMQTIMEARIKTVRERVPAVVQEELNEGLGELTSALESVVPGIGGIARMDDLPALSLMIAGLFAPTQLALLKGENNARLGFSALLLVMDAIAVGAGWNMRCVSFIFDLHGSFLRPWIVVDLVSVAFTVLIRLLAKSAVDRTLDDMKRFQEEDIELPSEPTMAFRAQLERQLLVGAQAMLQYDRLANSFSFKLLDVLPAFDFVWQIGGMMLLFDTPSQFCKAQFLMYWSRVRGIIFLIALIPTIIALVLSFLKSTSSSTGMQVLKAAREADKKLFPNGPPVVTLLVRAFLVRDATDMANMELQILEFEKRIAQAARDKLRKEYEAAVLEAKKHEETYDEQAKLCRVKSKEDEFMEQYRLNVAGVVSTLQFVQDPQAFAEQAAADLRANIQTAQQQMDARYPEPVPSEEVDDDGDGGTGGALGQLPGSLGSVGLPAGAEQAFAQAGAMARVGATGVSSALNASGQPPSSSQAPPRGEGGSGSGA